MRLEVLPDAEAAAARGAREIARAARDGVADRGSFALAVSGGRAPWRMFELLAGEEVPWEQVDVFQVDERVLPDGDPGRNLVHLLDSLPAPARARVRAMPVTAEDPDAAAAGYAAALPAALDLVHLGLGPDGHTASLVPGDSVLEVADRRVALTGGEYQGCRRMTLTYPELAGARAILWLVTGAEKRDPLRALQAHDPSIPAGRVEAPADTLILADDPAGGGPG
ncbi:MAG: 6-phosphogluconolactonase [Solirubrobacteraceae bacterium]|nr:6-phosphogluconolactonase [Solirubrobacteraceae bacterium]